MRREQRPAPIHAGQILQTGKPDRDAILGRGAAADLVHDDERAVRGVAQDMGRLEHLDHEGGLVAKQVVGGADAAEEVVDDAEGGVGGGNEGARLREDGDEGVLAQEGAFAGHVGTGEEPDGLGGADEAVVADECAALVAQALRDGRVAAGEDLVGRAEVEERAHVGLVVREEGEGAGDVEFVEDGGVATERDEVEDDALAEVLEDAVFFCADLELALVDGGAEGGPFGEVEGPRGFGGADAADVGEGFERCADVLGALDVAEMAQSWGPA